MPFQFNSKLICLTYSNVNQQARNGILSLLQYDKQSLLEFLQLKATGSKYICVSEEQHKDGNIHFHAAVRVDKPIRTRDERFWDWLGIHPNIQSARNWKHWVKYVKKDGNYIEDGAEDCGDIETVPELIELAKNSDKLSFLAYMSLKRFSYASTIWEMAHPEETHTVTNDLIMNLPARVDPCIYSYFTRDTWDREKVLILWGDTGLGKTTMAKILIQKPALMVSHLDDLKKYRSGYHQGIIFDDVSIKHLPETAQIHLCDYNDTRSIHVRYGTVTIPRGTEKIFTCNQYPVGEHPAISRRVQSVRCTKPSLFKDL